MCRFSRSDHHQQAKVCSAIRCEHVCGSLVQGSKGGQQYVQSACWMTVDIHESHPLAQPQTFEHVSHPHMIAHTSFLTTNPFPTLEQTSTQTWHIQQVCTNERCALRCVRHNNAVVSRSPSSAVVGPRLRISRRLRAGRTEEECTQFSLSHVIDVFTCQLKK